MTRFLIILFFIISEIAIIISCAKEYSYEGGPDPVIVRDSVITNSPNTYVCTSCLGTDGFILSKWNFYNNNDFYCGKIDTAIATPDRTGFTFFGPSSCSIDSGLVLTINISPTALTNDIFNLTTAKASMYYYDNIGNTHPFISQTGYTFTFTIDSYIHQTRIMTGTYSGNVFKPNGQNTTIKGKYKLRIP